MKISVKKVEFIKSFADIGSYHAYVKENGLPEICAAGRSNVGKSSFINMLAGRRIAKTSSTPGRTRLINLFNFDLTDGERDIRFAFIDLPGYGYAAAAKNEIKKWSGLIDDYFQTGNNLTHIFSLVDSRHAPSDLDKQMIKYMYHSGFSFTVIATKTDKLSKAEMSRNISMIAAELLMGRDNIIPVAAEKNYNKERVLEKIFEILSFREESQEPPLLPIEN